MASAGSGREGRNAPRVLRVPRVDKALELQDAVAEKDAEVAALRAQLAARAP